MTWSLTGRFSGGKQSTRTIVGHCRHPIGLRRTFNRSHGMDPCGPCAYVLLINPRLSPGDHDHEERPDFREALRLNLTGDRSYIYLQRRFADHSGSAWARRLFGPDISEAQANKICIIQLVAYHCANGDLAKRVSGHMPLAQRIVRFAQDWLMPRAKANEIGLVVGRASELWGIISHDECNSIVVYRGSECRGVSPDAGHSRRHTGSQSDFQLRLDRGRDRPTFKAPARA